MHRYHERFTSGGVKLPLDSNSSLPSEAQPQHDKYNIIGSSKDEFDQTIPRRSHPQWNHFYQTATDWWIFEVLACAGSIAALAGVIVILLVYDSRSLPNWPFGITINSVLAWFTTAMKALMLVAIAACISQAKWAYFHSNTRALADLAIYDSASRGAQGSVQLLWRFQARHVACLGALITILALSIDPVVQQVVSVETRNTKINYSPTLGRAQTFLQGPDADDDVEFDMLGAMYHGIFSDPGAANSPNKVSFAMNPSCPTGNCTFPIFQSLAVCHHCTNITDTVEGKCQTEVGGDGDDSILCKYSLPNGLKLNTTDLSKNSGAEPVASSGNLGLVGPAKFGNTLLNFTRMAGRSPSPHSISSTHNMAADECVLYWCVNTYQASVTNGALDEEVLRTFYSNTTEWHQDADRLNNVWLQLDTPSLDQPSTISKFLVAYLATTPLSDWLATKMSVSNSQAVIVVPTGFGWGPDITANTSADSMDTARVLWQPNIDTVFSNLAASMTRNIRGVDWNIQTYGDGWMKPSLGAGTANGTAWTTEVYIHVRWPWLTLPISLVVLTVVLLILTVIETAQSKVEIWKGSPIPLLFHGLGNTEAARLRWAAQLAEMETRAEDIAVRLESTDTGWKLVGGGTRKLSNG